jgi:hypothetical protein
MFIWILIVIFIWIVMPIHSRIEGAKGKIKVKSPVKAVTKTVEKAPVKAVTKTVEKAPVKAVVKTVEKVPVKEVAKAAPVKEVAKKAKKKGPMKKITKGISKAANKVGGSIAKIATAALGPDAQKVLKNMGVIKKALNAFIKK